MRNNIEKTLEKNKGLVYSVINKYYGAYRHDFFEDMVQVGMIGLYMAIKSYDETKGAKFSTWATTLIIHELYAFVDKYLSRYNGVLNGSQISINEKRGDENRDDFEQTLEDFADFTGAETNEIMSFIASKGERMVKIVSMREQGYSYREIGEVFGVSKQYIEQLMRKLKEEIRNKFNLEEAMF